MTPTCTARSHNSLNAYRKHRCRCPKALEAERSYARERASRRLRGQRPKSVGTDYDWVKVERALAGDMSIRLTVPELAAAVLRLDRRLWSAEEIAERLGVTQRTVQRHRAARREAEEKVRRPSKARRTQPAGDQQIQSINHRTADPRQKVAA